MKAIQLLTFAVTASILLGCSGGKVAAIYDGKTGQLIEKIEFSSAEECKKATTPKESFKSTDSCLEFHRFLAGPSGLPDGIATQLYDLCECLVERGYVKVGKLDNRKCLNDYKVSCESQ